MLKDEPNSHVLLRSLARAHIKLEKLDKCKEVCFFRGYLFIKFFFIGSSTIYDFILSLYFKIIDKLMSQGEDDVVLVLQGQYELMTGQCDKAIVRSVYTKGYFRTVVTPSNLLNFVYNLQHK